MIRDFLVPLILTLICHHMNVSVMGTSLAL